MRPATVALTLSILAAAGCGSAAARTSPPVAHGVPAAFTGTVEPLAPAAATDLGAEDEAFGLRLLHDVCLAAPTADTVLSPASAAEALGMLAAGARGSTRRALTDLLHQPAYGPGLVSALHAQTAALTGTPGLATSNRLFEQAGVTPDAQTLDDLATSYAAGLRTLDFARQPVAATDTVNRLVSADTHGLIPTLFDQPLDPSTVAVVTDAIYLHADWATPFARDDPAPFTTAAGQSVQVPTLAGDVTAAVTRADGWTAAALPYQGGRLTADALLPPVSATAPCSLPSASTVQSLLTSTPAGTDPVTMPSLHLISTHHLLDTLVAEGMQADGDYSGLGGQAVSDVVQKVDIAVDETGTTAAAATGGSAIATSTSAAEDGRIAFDRPYLLLITDTATHTPLFELRVADPRG